MDIDIDICFDKFFKIIFCLFLIVYFCFCLFSFYVLGLEFCCCLELVYGKLFIYNYQIICGRFWKLLQLNGGKCQLFFDINIQILGNNRSKCYGKFSYIWRYLLEMIFI